MINNMETSAVFLDSLHVDISGSMSAVVHATCSARARALCMQLTRVLQIQGVQNVINGPFA